MDWPLGIGGGVVVEQCGEGLLSSFINVDSTLADGVQFDTGSAWGRLQEGVWSECSVHLPCSAIDLPSLFIQSHCATGGNVSQPLQGLLEALKWSVFCLAS